MKIKKISLKLIIPVMIVFILTIIFVSAISLWKSSESITSEAYEKIEMMAGNYANEFSILFNEIESSTRALGNYVLDSFDLNKAKSERGIYINEYKNLMVDFVKLTAEKTNGNDSAYIHFDPGLSGEGHDIYFALENGIYVRQDEIGPEVYDPNDIDMDWYYEPFYAKSAIWTEPYEWDGIYYVSHTNAVFIDNIFIGTYGMDFLFEDIKNQINNLKIYDTGFAYLLNSDANVIVSNNNISLDNEVQNYIKNTLKNHPTGLYEHNDRILGFSVLKNGWIFVVEASKTEVLKSLNDLIWIQLIMLISSILVGVTIMLLIITKIIKSIKILTEKINAFGKGDLTVDFNIKSNDEIGLISHSLKEMSENISNLIKDLKDFSQTLSGESNSLAAASEESSASIEEISSYINLVHNNSEDTSASVEEVNSSIEEISSSAQSLSKSVKEFSGNTNETAKASEDGFNSIKSITKTVQEAKKQSLSTKQDVIKLTEKAQNVQEIVTAINSITEQTNLLALNAAIEAARAGTAGKGFAVVADEIRKLAEDSKNATNEISEILKEIKNMTINVNNSTEKTDNVIDNIKNESEKALSQFNLIFEKIKLFNSSIEKISTTSSEQSSGTEEISIAIDNVSKNIYNISAELEKSKKALKDQSETSKELTTSSEKLSEVSENLFEKIKFFKI
jgi:methyl-accepting chemotaxis protein